MRKKTGKETRWFYFFCGKGGGASLDVFAEGGGWVQYALVVHWLWVARAFFKDIIHGAFRYLVGTNSVRLVQHLE